ncbi:hypothetical protein SAMN05519105_0559 [Rhodobacter sp. 24-YEA-8]|nr:hypothetical protein SAMN05519105_0559 [Rhodobacter sp. 24-YEA-8]
MTDITPPDPGLIATINQFIGGAATALLAAFSGRAMYHAGEVRARRRWNAPTEVVQPQGYAYPVFRRTRLWLASERSPKLSF